MYKAKATSRLLEYLLKTKEEVFLKIREEENQYIDMLKKQKFAGNTRDANLDIARRAFVSQIYFENIEKNIKELCDFFQTPEKELIDNYKVFNSFDYFCKIMNDAGLNVSEKYEIILEIFSRNITIMMSINDAIKLNLLDISIIENNTSLKVYNFMAYEKNMANKENVEKINIIKPDKEDVFYLYRISSLISLTEIVDCEYFLKLDSYDKNDISKVYDALLSLGISQDICRYFKKQMVLDLNKRLAPKKQDTFSPKPIKFNSEKSNKTYLTDKEYKKLRKEINQYFDFYKVRLVKEDITYDEIIECAVKAKQIGIVDEDIKRFFMFADMIGKEYRENPLEYYKVIYDKLIYYEDKLGISEQIEELNAIAKEMANASQEDYYEWESMFLETLRKVYKMLPTNYEYELNLIKIQEKMII